LAKDSIFNIVLANECLLDTVNNRLAWPSLPWALRGTTKQIQNAGLGPLDGGVRLTPNNPDFEETMGIMEGLMAEYRDTLKTLAK
jgi:hypothetical protein